MDGMAEFSQEPGCTNERSAAKMQERLQKRNQTRIEDVERRRAVKDSQAVAEETSECFSKMFTPERASIEELLSSCSGAGRPAVNKMLEEATARTSQLQKFLNDSVMFLTQYELRKAQDALQKLQTSIAETKEEGLPKKKFAFRARAKASDKVSVPMSATPSPNVSSTVESGSTKMNEAAISEQCGFTNMENVNLTKTAEEIHKQDVLLTHLTNCKVHLIGSPSTLHLKHIDRCEILCGPVSTSVFVDHCKNSILAFPCQQLRTHNTTDTQVYLHVTSRAIIEDCRRVSIAPFTWSYPTFEEDFTVSGLDRGRNNWNKVDDFNWLVSGTPSPNWTIIPEEDRKTNWDP